MNQLGGFPLLTLIVFLPGLGAILAAFVPASRKDTVRWLALLIAAAAFFTSLFLYMGWITNPDIDMQFVDGPWDWVPRLGIRYHMGVDGANLHLIMLTTLMTPLVLLWPQEVKAKVVYTLFLETGILGALSAMNLVLFVAFLLLSLLSMFFLIDRDARSVAAPAMSRSAAGFLIRTAVVASLLLAVVAGILVLSSSLDPTLPGDFLPGWSAQAWLFWGIVLAMGVVAVAFPFHLGYPQLVDRLSPATHLLLNGLLINLGGYGLIRFCLTLFPLATTSFAPALVLIGAIGVVYGALGALGADSWSKTLGYWNVAQTGLMVVGIFVLQDLGLHGAIAYLVGRGLSVIALVILSNKGARPDRPITRIAAALALLSAVGLPALAGFPGQSMLVQGLLRWHWQVSATAVTNTLLDWIFYAAVLIGLAVAAAALFRGWHKHTTGPAGPDAVSSRETWIAVPVLVVALIFGLFSYRFSDTIGPTAFLLLNEVDLGTQRTLQQMSPPQDLDQPPPKTEGEKTSWIAGLDSIVFLDLSVKPGQPDVGPADFLSNRSFGYVVPKGEYASLSAS